MFCLLLSQFLILHLLLDLFSDEFFLLPFGELFKPDPFPEFSFFFKSNLLSDSSLLGNSCLLSEGCPSGLLLSNPPRLFLSFSSLFPCSNLILPLGLVLLSPHLFLHLLLEFQSGLLFSNPFLLSLFSLLLFFYFFLLLLFSFPFSFLFRLLLLFLLFLFLVFMSITWFVEPW